MNAVGMGSEFIARLGRFAADQRGATAVEYGLIVAAVSVAILVVLFQVGAEMNTMFGKIITFLSAATA